MKSPKWSDCKTNADRWAYYTHVYAWRILRGLAQPHETTSPVDPNGEWYNQAMVQTTLARMRDETPRYASNVTFTDEELEERREWARREGYTDWNEFLEAVEAGKASIMPFMVWATTRRGERGPPQVGTFVRLGAALAPRAAAPIGGLPPPPGGRTDPIHDAHAELGVSVSEAAE